MFLKLHICIQYYGDAYAVSIPQKQAYDEIVFRL